MTVIHIVSAHDEFSMFFEIFVIVHWAVELKTAAIEKKVLLTDRCGGICEVAVYPFAGRFPREPAGRDVKRARRTSALTNGLHLGSQVAPRALGLRPPVPPIYYIIARRQTGRDVRYITQKTGPRRNYGVLARRNERGKKNGRRRARATAKWPATARSAALDSLTLKLARDARFRDRTVDYKDRSPRDTALRYFPHLKSDRWLIGRCGEKNERQNVQLHRRAKNRIE